MSSELVDKPLVALVGRPNVGKSTLFNRLVGGHHAIVEDEPGVTRDRRYGDADWDGKAFRVVDTGGLDPAAGAAGGRPPPGGGRGERGPLAGGGGPLFVRAIDEAALILFVLDAQEGVTSGDREAADVIRRSGKRVLWVANKVDGARQEPAAAEVYGLGADEVVAVSGTHGRNIAELCDAILA